MPRFIRATDIPMSVRRPHLERYRRQLRDALLHPALTQEQRDEIKTKLARAGQIKVYGPKGAYARPSQAPERRMKVEAAESTEVLQGSKTETAENVLEDLLAKTKRELLALAQKEGTQVSESWTKRRISETILSARAGS